mmetsp:Transcript_14345/g.21879  ORF Transcript_14345/g.21879 Transcript_14345/m.21879 type:complete len:213 (+) Transcript_14345:192-830(+)
MTTAIVVGYQIQVFMGTTIQSAPSISWCRLTIAVHSIFVGREADKGSIPSIFGNEKVWYFVAIIVGKRFVTSTLGGDCCFFSTKQSRRIRLPTISPVEELFTTNPRTPRCFTSATIESCPSEDVEVVNEFTIGIKLKRIYPSPKNSKSFRVGNIVEPAIFSAGKCSTCIGPEMHPSRSKSTLSSVLDSSISIRESFSIQPIGYSNSFTIFAV